MEGEAPFQPTIMVQDTYAPSLSWWPYFFTFNYFTDSQMPASQPASQHREKWRAYDSFGDDLAKEGLSVRNLVVAWETAKEQVRMKAKEQVRDEKRMRASEENEH